tara:strand:- start:81706 stop:82440 length:735 start_codon:yes stop_codon:yes gene_type:complete
MNTSNPLEFGGRVILLAGDTGETGKQIAEAFLTAGANVALCARTAPERLPEAAGCQAWFTPLAEGNPEHIAAAVDSVFAHYGRIDALVSIPADSPSPGHRSTGSQESDLRRELFTPLHFSQAVNRLMQQQAEGGSIINICRADEPLSTSEPCVLAAACAGLANLGSSLAVEWAPRVRVNTIRIVLPHTEHPEPEQHRRQAGVGHGTSPAAGARGQLPGIGNTCLFLASTLASYISGTQLTAANT